MAKKKSTIQFNVVVDENQVPEKITWNAEGSEKSEETDSKAIMLTIWDQNENNTLRIDLWTKEMMVDEMKKFTCQNIITMAEAFERATGETAVAKEIKRFGENIAIKLGVMKK